MKILNKTHYYNAYTRIYNEFASPYSFQSEENRRNGYYQRMYYEFLYTKKVLGSTFYYTLTYNNKSIPKYFAGTEFEFNCFSYDDIRLVTNGSLVKDLQRNYGIRMKYALFCESGEGKGSRGIGNNPHYHIIFFLQPIHDNSGNPIYQGYKPISSFEFMKKIKDLWQGNDSKDYRQFRFGIAKQGKLNAGEVTDVSAFRYCCKYCVKDAAEKNRISLVRKYHYEQVILRKFDSLCLLAYIYYKRCAGFKDFLPSGMLHLFNRYRKTLDSDENSLYYFISRHVLDDIDSWFEDFKEWYYSTYINMYIDNMSRDYINRYSGKPRVSKSLGEFGLNYIINAESEPGLKMPSPSGMKIYTPCLYYIRKLYYDVYKCPITGNPLFVLNALGRKQRINHLDIQVQSHIERTRQCLSFITINNFISPSFDGLYGNQLGISEEKPSIKDTLYEPARNLLNNPNLDSLLFKYAIYKIVYEYRSIYPLTRLSVVDGLTLDNVKEDYSFFLKSAFFFNEYDDLYQIHRVPNDVWIPCFSLSVFKPFIQDFKELDRLCSFVTDIVDDGKRMNYNESSEHRKRLASFDINQQYPELKSSNN